MARFRASRFTRTARPTRATQPKKAAPEPEETAETPAASASSGGRSSGIPRGKPVAQEEPASTATRFSAARDRARSAPESEPSPGRTGESGGRADAASGYRTEDFTSRAESAGATTFTDGRGAAPAGADRLPGAVGDAVAGNLGGEEATLIDPSKLAGEGRQMPAGAPTATGSAQTADLRGMAGRADQTTSMADSAGISEEDKATAGADNTQTEDSSTAREYLSGNSDGAGQSLDVDNMSDAEVTEAAAVEADYEVGVGPARDYLKGGSDRTGQTPDVDKMTNEEVLDEVNKEAEYEFRGGSGSAPSYVDADGAGAVDSATAAQVAADEKRLGAGFDVDNPSTPGNVDPNEFGAGAQDARDTSILDMSDPGSADAADSFGSGTMGSGPPPKADIDYGEDYVDTNPAGGPYDDVGGISQAPIDDTVDFDPPDEAGALSFTEAEPSDLSNALDDLTDALEDDIDGLDL